MILRRSLSLAALLAFLLTALSVQAATVPDTLMYEGKILNTQNSPVTTALVLRLSFWKSADWTSGDSSAGAINTGATNYGEWYETQNVTPNSNGNFLIQMGSSTALPAIDFTKHKYLQVEVKNSGEPDTSYILLDPTGDNGADAVDRKTIASVAYAKNAESVDNRTVGTASGNILILGPNGKIQAAQMGSGTNTEDFTINADNTEADVTLTFGNSLLPATLKYSQSASRFEFSDDVLINGNLTIDSGGTVTASGAIATEGGLTINKDNAATDATLTFGNSLGEKTIKFSSTNQQFEFNDDVAITGNLTVTGLINGVELSALAPLQVASGPGLTIMVGSGSYRLGNSIVNFGGTSGVPVSINSTSYVFFGSGGLIVRSATFPTDEAFIPLAIVTSSATEITNVTDRRVLQSDVREHDILKVLTPGFDKATFQGDASDNVGQLTTTADNITQQNYYLWTSSRPTLQDYDIFVRILLPQDFVRWKSDGGLHALELTYRSTSASAADNALDILVYDTNGTPVALSGTTSGLASTSWTTTSIDFLNTPTWTAGQEFLVKLHMSAKNNYQTHIGSIKLRSTSLMGQ